MNVKEFTAKELDNMNLVATLTAKTQKGKQRIKQYGASGKVLRVFSNIPASSVEGLWFAVPAADPTYRWVNFDEDPDFTMKVDIWNCDASVKMD